VFEQHPHPGHRPRRRGPDAENGAAQGHDHGRHDHVRGFERHMRGFGPGRSFAFGLGGVLGRGPAVRRGDVRAAILAVLAERPMHGYQVMQELRERSGGAWAPSAGSVYPTLQQLEDEGLVRSEEQEGRRVFTLTDQGGIDAAKAQQAGAPWEIGRDQAASEIRALAMQVGQAAMQVYQVGTPAAITEARRILVAARRDIYRLLADDESGVPADEANPGPDEG
jgi:DNA-binding PadR family transcriptional regulator